MMTPAQFKTWRKVRGLKQREMADLLGLKKRIIQYYEKGERDGKRIEIPKSVRLACYALERGVIDFDGTNVERRQSKKPSKKLEKACPPRSPDPTS